MYPMTFTPEEIMNVLNAKPIPAVMSLRTRSGMGLRQAKEAIDELRKELGMKTTKACIHCLGTGRTTHYLRWQRINPDGDVVE